MTVDGAAVGDRAPGGRATGTRERPEPLRRVLVIGAGLIGTSVALALREQELDVALYDQSSGRLALAVELGAGRPLDLAGAQLPDKRGEPGEPGKQLPASAVFDVALVAVPPDAVASEVLRLQRLGLARTYTDVASVKARPLVEAEALGVDMTTYLAGHPVAGRERSGPAAAHADLFVGRPWVITPTSATTAGAIADVCSLAVACGARPVTMAAEAHDAALAQVSHVPHVVASVLAAQLVRCDDATVGLGGTGLHDTTRVAAGDAALWTEILAANAAHVADALDGFMADVQRAAVALRSVAQGDAGALGGLTELLAAGVAGRARVPGKRGESASRFVTVPVVVRDAPGELAALLRTLGDAGINVEDVRVEHQPGRPVGLVELDVREDVVSRLVGCVRGAGWQVYT